MLHTPVMCAESVAQVITAKDGCYVDATFGRGGHTQALLARLDCGATVYGFDRDADAIAYGRKNFAADARLRLLHTSFSQLAAFLSAPVHGVLFDLGLSSTQLEDGARGFSFVRSGALDMRFDQRQRMTAQRWLQQTSGDEIARVLREYGEERYAKRIAEYLVHARRNKKLPHNTLALAQLIHTAQPRHDHRKHSATRCFQALRMAVNDEPQELLQALQVAWRLLIPGGRIAVLSFHSLESRMAKRFWQQHRPQAVEVCKISPSADEITRNRRARSALLRVIAKRV